MYFNDNLSVENALQVAKALPSLSELYLELKNDFSIDEVIIHFVNTIKQLKKIHFILEDQSEFDNLCVRLSGEWNASDIRNLGRKKNLQIISKHSIIRMHFNVLLLLSLLFSCCLVRSSTNNSYNMHTHSGIYLLFFACLYSLLLNMY